MVIHFTTMQFLTGINLGYANVYVQINHRINCEIEAMQTLTLSVRISVAID